MKDKCLIYSPEITEDIFNQVIKKVESQGYKLALYGTNNNYYGFIKYGGLYLSSNSLQWCTAVRRGPLPQEIIITVADILKVLNGKEVFPIMINVPRL